jgi:hypothetical protein
VVEEGLCGGEAKAGLKGKTNAPDTPGSISRSWRAPKLRSGAAVLNCYPDLRLGGNVDNEQLARMWKERKELAKDGSRSLRHPTRRWMVRTLALPRPGLQKPSLPLHRNIKLAWAGQVVVFAAWVHGHVGASAGLWSAPFSPPPPVAAAGKIFFSKHYWDEQGVFDAVQIQQVEQRERGGAWVQKMARATWKKNFQARLG